MTLAATTNNPVLSGLVAHWHNEDEVEQLIRCWPEDPRFELIVVDNGSARPVEKGRSLWIEAQGNSGFAGAINRAAKQASGQVLLILNPDARPDPEALEELLDGFDRHPDCAGLAPRLVGDDGSEQFAWQLRNLPSAMELLRHAAFIPTASPLTSEPPPGSRVEQPAAAALAIRRRAFDQLAGLDEGFHPAWFEDVDLARRAQLLGLHFLYWPAATFVHGLGSSVPRLGYGPFLWTYYRNLTVYLEKHHGTLAALLARLLLPVTAMCRIVTLPLKRPSRSSSRREALGGLLTLALGAVTGWQLPASRRSSAPGSRAPVKAKRNQ